MHAFRTIVFASAIAGLLVGLIVTLAQQAATVPLIQKAELYEHAGGAGFAAPAAPMAGPDAAGPRGGRAHEHAGHEHAAWEPAGGAERTAYSAAANVATAVGFALLLCAAYELRGGAITWREGLVWGLGGFVAFVAAPGLGLPPAPPGMPVAALGARQLWWLGTAAATALGLGLLAFRRSTPTVALALVLFALPHLVGAPRSADPSTDVPPDITRAFVAAVVLTGLLFWALLGCVTGAVYRWLSARGGAGRTGPSAPFTPAGR